MTSPFGGVPLDDVTAAVKVTAWPGNDGFSEEVKDVLVDAIIFSLRGAEVLPVLLKSPVYFAEMT